MANTMNNLRFKVVSYITRTQSQPFIHGYYSTEQEAVKVRDNYNKAWSHGYLTAHVESI